MVVDDVWREQDLRPFLQGGRNCVRLVTTRIDSVLPEKAVRQKVDAMQAGEALCSAVRRPAAGSGRRANARASQDSPRGSANGRCLLKIVNGFLRDRVVKASEPLPVAIAGANKRLDAKGLAAFDPRDETERTKAVARTIGVSLDLLSEPERERFGELGVFPEDADIPVGVVARLWAATGGLEDFETEDLLGRLFDLSLLLELDLGQGFFRLHDTVRHFLRDRAGKERLVAQHKALVASLDGAGDGCGRADSPLLLPQSSASPRRGGRARKAGRAAARSRLAQGEARRDRQSARARSSTISNMARAKRRASSAGRCG